MRLNVLCGLNLTSESIMRVHNHFSETYLEAQLFAQPSTTLRLVQTTSVRQLRAGQEAGEVRGPGELPKCMGSS